MNNSNNIINESLSRNYLEMLRNKYGKRMDVVAKEFPNFSEAQATTLSVLLENVDQEFAKRSRIFEGTQTGGVADGIKNQYFDIITAAFPNLISEEIFSVQPLRQKYGQLFYLEFKYGSNKGGVAKGSTMFANNNVAGYENRNYTSEVVDDEILFTTDASATSFSGNFAYVPMKAGTVNLTLGAVTITDNGNGVLTGTGVTSGTVDYNSGAFTLTFGSAPSADDCTASYEYDMSFAPSTIPEMDLVVRETTVSARPRKLRANYSLDAGYDLQMSQGININDALLEASATNLRHEVDGELIMTAHNQAGSQTQWSDLYNPATSGLGKRAFYEDCLDSLIQASSLIRKKTLRVGGNFIVVGKRLGDILDFIGAPRYVSNGQVQSVGPHFAGTLDGQWKIYKDPFLGDDEFLIGFKGDTMIDAGLIYAPYLPFFATDTIMLDDFVGRRGFATTYGKKMVNSDYYVRGVITHA